MGGRGSSSSNSSMLVRFASKLEGSEKQIKWAEDIRKGAMREIEEELKVFNSKQFITAYKGYKERNGEESLRCFEAYRKILESNKASDWISNRHRFEQTDDIITNDIKNRSFNKVKEKLKEGKIFAVENYIQHARYVGEILYR